MEYYLVDKFNRGLYPKHKKHEKEKTSLSGLECMMSTLNKQKTAKHWHAKNMKIAFIDDPSQSDEAVNLRTFYKALRLRSYGKKSAYDCQNNKIKSLAHGTDEKDAVNVKQVHDSFEKLLTEFNTALANYLKTNNNEVDCKNSVLTSLKAGVSKGHGVVVEQTLTVKENQPHFFGCGDYVYDLTKSKI